MQGNVDYTIPPPVEGVGGGGTGYGWSEIGTRSLNTTAGVIDVNKHPTSDLLHVWSMPSTATIGHQEHPRPLEQINLLAARNEKESAQIALRPKVSWSSGGFIGHVQIQCTDLCSTSGSKLETGKAITLRRVVPILGVPDALVPLELPLAQIGLLPGETLGLWLSIEVPATQPPGYYEGEISFLAIRAESEIESADSYDGDKLEIKKEIQEILTRAKARENNPQEGMQAITEELRHLIQSTLLTANRGEQGKMDIDEEYNTTLAVRLKFSLTVWDYVIPVTPTLPAVFGISETVIEDRFGLEHGSIDWYKSLDMHFQWLLHYRLSPYFCRWGDNMRVLAYTCPWPADHPKAEEYYSNPRLTAYAVPYLPVLNSSDAAKESLKRELEILRTKDHWKKAYIYLWDEPLSLEQYGHIHRMADEIRSTAPDARVLTTYYCGPNDASVVPGSFEAFVKVPTYLRPHTQIFCTSEWVLGGREELVQSIVAELQPENKEEWWTYVCMGPSDPHPNWHLGMRGTQHRAVLWRVWKEGGTGFLYWGANCYDKALTPSTEIRFRRGLPPGDGVLYYPGEVFTPGSTVPVASVRLERILSGMQDFEYLQLYSSIFGRLAGLALLEKTGMYYGPERYTHEHTPVESMRSEVFRACRAPL
ncbi:hypothetical protein Mapa_004319 [Marchantia paleacea]|nr:hypothetical protein Mapa_004319 [Marchantia paleacea]